MLDFPNKLVRTTRRRRSSITPVPKVNPYAMPLAYIIDQADRARRFPAYAEEAMSKVIAEAEIILQMIKEEKP